MAKSKKKRKSGILPKLIVLAFVIYSAITLVSLQMKINAQRSAVTDLEKQVAAENTKQTQLKQLLKSDVNNSYVISEAQKAGYAAPNERVFVDVSGE